MQQLRIHAPGKVSLDEVPVPEPGPRDAVVRVQACGICGSDLGYIALGGVAGPTPEPTALGHEFSAVVDRVGAEVTRVAPGQRVVVNPIAGANNIGNGGPGGAFAREVLVQEVEGGDVIFPIPDDLPFDRAALAEPLGVGMHAVDRAGVAPGDKVVIFGAGPIGLMALATLRYRGFDDVAIVDLSENRLEIARRLGATLALDPGAGDIWEALRELHGTELWLGAVPTTGSDAYIEASGAASVIGELVGQARPGARISVVALHRTPREVDFMMVMAKQLTLAGSMAYPDDYGEMVRLLSEVDLSPSITHRFPLAAIEEALAVAGDPGRAGKVIVEP
ncbi:MAG: zinc-binding dehydrogenase [Myxococcota bacterium]|nr:zinc-binding dehydrogenase [Myxococcota bacterium]